MSKFGKTVFLSTVVFGLFACVSTPQRPQQSPQVEANGERLEGAWTGDNESIAVFKGVPYAAAPLGSLRWRAPQAHKVRQGLQVATTYAPACMQSSSGVDWYIGVAAAFGHDASVVGRPNGMSEDCLYLNVWSPDLDENRKLPVLVWIHGGSNKGGWAYEPNYVGTQLAARGVVVVSVAYRLGPLGFFSHPNLTAQSKDEVVANFGWLDQFAALAWVRENAGAFGGDADNITVLGESAGGGDALNMIGNSLRKRPYRKFIAQSPAMNIHGRLTLEDEQRNGERLAAALDIANDKHAVERLRQLPAETIIEAGEKAWPNHYHDVVVDGTTFTNTPLQHLRANDVNNVDVLAGANRDEWYMYLPDDTDWDDVDEWLGENVPERADALRAELAGERDPRRALDRLRTARNLVCPLRQMAARINATGGRAYIYDFTRQRNGAGGEQLKAYHGTELPYVFDMHDAWLPTDETDRQLTEIVMDYWVQFARTGDPNVIGRPAWPQYRQGYAGVLELGDTVRTVATADANLCELFDAEKN